MVDTARFLNPVQYTCRIHGTRLLYELLRFQKRLLR